MQKHIFEVSIEKRNLKYINFWKHKSSRQTFLLRIQVGHLSLLNFGMQFCSEGDAWGISGPSVKFTWSGTHVKSFLVSLARLMRSAGIVVRHLTAKQKKHSCLTTCGKSPAAYCIFFFGGGRKLRIYMYVWIHMYIYTFICKHVCICRYIYVCV